MNEDKVTCSDCEIRYNNTDEATERARLSGQELEEIVVLCPRHASVDALYDAAKLAIRNLQDCRETDEFDAAREGMRVTQRGLMAAIEAADRIA